MTDVITDVIGNDGRVARVILTETSLDLTGKIGTDIGSLGVDTTTDAAEESDRGTTETVAGNRLVHVDGLIVAARAVRIADSERVVQVETWTEKKNPTRISAQGRHIAFHPASFLPATYR
jgi:hypothetical protein